MPTILSILYSILITELSSYKNQLGWSVTWLTIYANTVEHLNQIGTLLLTIASFVWVVVKIVTALKTKKDDTDK